MSETLRHAIRDGKALRAARAERRRQAENVKPKDQQEGERS
jgi:hypothetical protein